MLTYRAALLTLVASLSAVSAQARPVVLELYTSQGCSSCPPADALLKELAANPQVIALSFHVHYWDRLGWRDPFSSESNTQRQYQYAHNMHLNSVFTPQLVVDGSWSAVGSDPASVRDALQSAAQQSPAVPVRLTPGTKAGMLHVRVESDATTPPADVYVARYRKLDRTQVVAGENNGRTLVHVNSVTSFTHLGSLAGHSGDYDLALPANEREALAILVQASGQGRILGAESYSN